MIQFQSARAAGGRPAGAPAADGRAGGGALWRRWERGRWRRVVWRAGWSATAAAGAAVTFAHLLPQDFMNEQPGYLLAASAAFVVFTFGWHLGLAMAMLSALAAWRRCPVMTGAAVVVAVAAMGPTLWLSLPQPFPEVERPALRIMSVNLLVANERHEAIIEEVRAADPDVLLIQEYSERWSEALAAGLAELYPHRVGAPRDDEFGMAIYSKRGLADLEMHLPLGEPRHPQFRVVIEHGGREVAIYNLHLAAPLSPGHLARGRRQFAHLLGLLEVEELPFIVAGDFNFTPESPRAGALRVRGIADAHELAAWGRGATWTVSSAARYLPVPRVRIDHAFISPGLRAVDARVGTGAGSDHRPVIADVAFPR